MADVESLNLLEILAVSEDVAWDSEFVGEAEQQPAVSGSFEDAFGDQLQDSGTDLVVVNDGQFDQGGGLKVAVVVFAEFDQVSVNAGEAWAERFVPFMKKDAAIASILSVNLPSSILSLGFEMC